MPKSIRFNDLLLVLLSNAAARDNGSVVPLPESCTQDTGPIGKAVASLQRRKLVAEIPVTDRSLCWREVDQDMIGLFITDAGRAAIGAEGKQDVLNDTAGASETATGTVDETAPEKPTSPRPVSKIGSVTALLGRDQGATLDEMVEATGWLPHTTRAALAGLRKKGHTIAKTKRGDATCYKIAAEA